MGHTAVHSVVDWIQPIGHHHHMNIGVKYYLGSWNDRAYSFPYPSVSFTEWLYLEYGYEPWDTPDNWVLEHLLKQYNRIFFFEPTDY